MSEEEPVAYARGSEIELPNELSRCNIMDDRPGQSRFPGASQTNGYPQEHRTEGRRAIKTLPQFKGASTYHSIDGPGAYFITFTTYGSWLPGDERSFVDVEHNDPHQPRMPPDFKRMRLAKNQLKHPPIVFNLDQRECILGIILEVCRHRGWWAHAVHVRTNHVHAVVSAALPPEKVMNDFKAYATRGLRTSSLLAREIDPVWTEHGSTRYLWNDDQFSAAIDYVREQQGSRNGYGEGPVPDACTNI